MATTEQIITLRRRLNDFYGSDGVQLLKANQAFADDELNDLINDGFLEVSDGARTFLTAQEDDVPMAMLVARIDGILTVAQDEARRMKWEINNKVVDKTETAKSLTNIARELRARYQAHRARKTQVQIEDKTERPSGGLLKFNNDIPLSSSRDFDNRDTRRNTPRR